MGLSEAIQRPVLAYADAAKRRHADRLRATAGCGAEPEALRSVHA
jgi:hypothetical protein